MDLIPSREADDLFIPPPNPQPQHDPGTLNGQRDIPAQYWMQFWRIKWFIVAFAILGVALGLVVAALQTPLYRARTSLELRTLNQNYLGMHSIDPVAGNDSLETFLQTQIQLLESSTLIQRTVEKLVSSNPAVVTSPKPPGWRPRRFAHPRQESTSKAVWEIAGHLNIKGSGLTRLVEIVCESPHPALAAQFANVLAAEYIEQTLENRWDSTRQTGEWLTRKVQELKLKLQTAEEDLQSYSASAGLVFTNDKDNVAMEELRRIEAELSAARLDLVRKQSRYEQAVTSPPEALPEVLESADLRETRSKLLELRRELAEAGTSMKPGHPTMQKLNAQVAALTAELQSGREQIIRRIQNDYEEAQRRERLLWQSASQQRNVMRDQLSKETRYNLLRREVESTRLMYDSMLQRLKEVGVAGAMPVSNVRIVDAAQAPTVPALPNRSLNMALGLVFGSLCGLVVGFARLHSDRYLKAPGEAGLLLRMPELGAVPALACDPVQLDGWIRRLITDRKRQPHKLRFLDEKRYARFAATRNRAVDLALVVRDNSAMAEAYRGVLPAILFANEQGRLRSLVFTSANPREGKTSLTSNLAIGLAELKKRVLLIDGDVRNPSVHAVFGLVNEFGLSDLLEGDPAAAIRGPVQSGVEGLFVLPAGRTTVETKNLLHSERMAELLSGFEAEFDIVLIDTAPALLMRDARLIGRFADGVVLIVRAGQTSREAASAVAAKFRQDGTPVLGVVLNDWKPGAGDPVYGKSYLNAYRNYHRD